MDCSSTDRSLAGGGGRGGHRHCWQDFARQGAAQAHLLSAVSHHLGLTLYQTPVADTSNELTVMQRVMQSLVRAPSLAREGRIVTMDALLTQRAIAAEMVQKGALRDGRKGQPAKATGQY